MKLSGSQIIPASREIVWNGLNDPKVLKQCIPGCESITQVSPTELTAKVVAKVGPVKASFQGAVKLSEVNPPESCRMSGQGQGGLAGFASGGASIRLTALGPTETQLDYDADAQIGGKLAMLGSRLIDGTARSYAAGFFEKFGVLMRAEGERAAVSQKVVQAPPAKANKPVSKTAKKPQSKTTKKPAAKASKNMSKATKKPAAKAAKKVAKAPARKSAKKAKR